MFGPQQSLFRPAPSAPVVAGQGRKEGKTRVVRTERTFRLGSPPPHHTVSPAQTTAVKKHTICQFVTASAARVASGIAASAALAPSDVTAGAERLAPGERLQHSRVHDSVSKGCTVALAEPPQEQSGRSSDWQRGAVFLSPRPAELSGSPAARRGGRPRRLRHLLLRHRGGSARASTTAAAI